MRMMGSVQIMVKGRYKFIIIRVPKEPADSCWVR